MENYDVYYNYMNLIQQGVPFQQAAEQSGLLAETSARRADAASQMQQNHPTSTD